MFVGIDLGTTFSVVSVFSNDKITFIEDQGSPLIPSVVCFANSNVYVGRNALELEDDYPESTIRSSKRYIGQSTHLYKDYTAKAIAEQILDHLKYITEKQLEEEIEGIVICCPAYFNQNQRLETKEAAEDAGLNVLRIISEPTAAAIYYGESTQLNELCLIYDAGGSTFDVTILQLSGDDIYDILSVNGDMKLGGDDFDELIKQEFIKQLPENFKPFKDFDVRLNKFAEEVKIMLNYKSPVKKTLKYCGTINSKIYHHEFSTQSEIYQNLIQSLLLKTKSCALNALNDANKKISDLSKIILVGGTTKSKYIREFVKKEFNTDVYHKLDPDLTVAAGAAKLAHSLSQKIKGNILLLDVTPLSLGIETKGGLLNKIIPRNTKIPVASEQEFITSEDNQDSVIIKIFQGERPISKDNELLGEFELSGFPKRPRGQTKIVVKFEIDNNGLITVTGIDKETGLKSNIVLNPITTQSDVAYLESDESELTQIVLEGLKEEARTLMLTQIVSGENKEELDEIYEATKDNIEALKVFINSMKNVQ